MTQALQQNSGNVLSVSEATLAQLGERVDVPKYDRKSLKCGIAHMSIGGFHRSHQAMYIDDLMNTAPGDWLIAGIGLMSQDKEHCDSLKAQDGLYTVLERTKEKDSARVVGSIKTILHAPTEQQAVIDTLTNPDIKILSLTITEKGYMYDETGELNANHPAVQEDLKNPQTPKTALGYMALALKLRKERGIDPFTIMSCDNLPGNGHLTKKILLSYIALQDKELRDWVDANVAFPSAMVDRITPVTTGAVVERLEQGFGIADKWPVVCEDFRQWVLEDHFGKSGRPALEKVGVQLVDDVEPYEKMKVRLLNGSHSALSYVSYLMGYREVDVAMADPLISKFVRLYMDKDITPSVPNVPGIDLTDYKDTLIRRFSNPGIRDQVQRLAEDGSQKIPNAIIPCIRYQLKNGGSYKFAALAIAGWYRYLDGVDETMEAIAIKDPKAETMTAIAKIDNKNPERFLGIESIFGGLDKEAPFVEEVKKALTMICEKGTKATLDAYINGS